MLGAVVTELDQAGQKARTYVYQGGRVLAWQKKDGTTEVEALHMIRKGQVKRLDRNDSPGQARFVESLFQVAV